MVERTVVTLNGDEDPIVTKTKITVAQQRADAEARRRLIEQGKVDNESSTVAGAIVDERPCLGFGYWISLYDETSFHGDEICFNGHGWAYLPNYLRLTGFTCEAFPFICEPIFGTWDRAVRSVITGITVGHLCPIGDFCWEFNGAQFIPSTSDPRILNASWVHLE